MPSPLPETRWALTPPFHPYPAASAPLSKAFRWRGGLLSVALSLGSPPPDVIRHRCSMEPGLSSNRHLSVSCGARLPGRLARPSYPSLLTNASRKGVSSERPPLSQLGSMKFCYVTQQNAVAVHLRYSSTHSCNVVQTWRSSHGFRFRTRERTQHSRTLHIPPAWRRWMVVGHPWSRLLFARTDAWWRRPMAGLARRLALLRHRRSGPDHLRLLPLPTLDDRLLDLHGDLALHTCLGGLGGGSRALAPGPACRCSDCPDDCAPCVSARFPPDA